MYLAKWRIPKLLVYLPCKTTTIKLEGTRMAGSITLKYRKRRDGPENLLVEAFLNGFQYLFEFPNLEVSIITEAFLGNSFPDILFVIWDKKALKLWTKGRNDLLRNDIKVLNHLVCSQCENDISNISQQLGFSLIEVKNSVERLSKANLITEEKDLVQPKSLEEIFFIRRIISVEAKIKNWKDALLQAQINELSVSHSYILLPDVHINNNLRRTIGSTKTGLISQTSDEFKIRKDAVPYSIPASYFSWIINENIGRQFAT